MAFTLHNDQIFQRYHNILNNQTTFNSKALIDKYKSAQKNFKETGTGIQQKLVGNDTKNKKNYHTKHEKNFSNIT